MWILRPLWGGTVVFAVIMLIAANAFLSANRSRIELHVAVRALEPLAAGAKLSAEDVTAIILATGGDLDRPASHVPGRILSRPVVAGQLITTEDIREPSILAMPEWKTEQECRFYGRGPDSQEVCLDDGTPANRRLPERLMQYLDKLQRERSDTNNSALAIRRFLDKLVETYATKLGDMVNRPGPSTTPDSQVSIFFAVGSTLLPSSSGRDLAPTITRARDASCVILVTGYTDGLGRSEFNLALAQRRASAVAKFIAEQGIDRRHIVITSSHQILLGVEDQQQNDPSSRRADVRRACGGRSIVEAIMSD